ncbi:NACHT domain-containing protein [Microbacterium testaceum]|uniref:NACHT domain-containing protein n=1 Tax=Microbacterium testaceum TaxID=2033 RepID=UPI00128F5402|nr:hypothetical protein [Microbacterium testaceum]
MRNGWGPEEPFRIRFELGQLIMGRAPGDGPYAAAIAQTTKAATPTLNLVVRRRSGLGDAWTDDDTWAFTQYIVCSHPSPSAGLEAAKEMLGWGPDSAPEDSANEKKSRAIARLGRNQSAGSIRFKKGDSRGYYIPEGGPLGAMVDALGKVLADACETGAQQAFHAERESSADSAAQSQTHPSAKSLKIGAPPQAPGWAHLAQDLIAALDVPPPSYPAHLVPSVLARPLRVSNEANPNSTARSTAVEVTKDVPLSEAARRHNRLVVLGTPGSGKSTALIAGVLTSLLDQHPSAFVRLPDLAVEMLESGPPTTPSAATEMLLAVACRGLGIHFDRDGTGREQARALLEDPQALIALDGLDEVNPSAVSHIGVLLRHLGGVSGRVVMSSRPIGYSPPVGPWFEVVVDPLPPDYAPTLMRSWFEATSPEKRERAERALLRDASTHLTAQPVLLGIVATVAAEGEIPLDRGRLYDRYVKIVLQRMWRAPDKWRPSLGDVLDRARTAAEIAWFGATGGGGINEVGDWVDTVCLNDLEQSASAVDPYAAQDLLENDVLLSPHGRETSRVHQRYLWAHRTLQEHLVGAYLALLRQRNPEEWRRQVRLLMLGPSARWQEPLMHMAQLLSRRDQVSLFSEMSFTAARVDPYGNLSKQTVDVMCALPIDAPARRSAARWAAALNRWDHVAKLDNEFYLEAWPNALLNGNTEWPFYIDSNSLLSRREWATEIVLRARESAQVNRGTYLELLRGLLTVDGDQAFSLYLDELEQGSEELLVFGFVSEISDGIVDMLLRRGRSLDPRGWLKLLHSLLFADVTGEYRRKIGGVANRGELFYLESRIEGSTLDVDSLLRGEYSDIAQSKYGADVAFAFGRMATREWRRGVLQSPLEFDEDMPYALLGRSVSDLDDETCLIGGNHDVSDSLLVLFSADSETIRDVGAVDTLVQAARVCTAAAHSIPLSIAFDLYRRFLGLCNAVDEVTHLPERSALSSVAYAFLRILRSLPREGVLRHLLASSPADWPVKVEAGRPLLDLYDIFPSHPGFDASTQLTADEFAEVLLWGGAQGWSVAESLRGFSARGAAEQIATHLWEHAPEVALLPGNAEWLAYSLREQGRLQAWVDRLSPIERDW